MLGDALLLMPDVTVSPADGFGVLLMAGLPAAGSGVCADARTGISNKAVNATVDKPNRK
jgi:hypothetical protein